jgi:hypothetical protein
MADFRFQGKGTATHWTWRHHVRRLASISQVLLQAVGDSSEFDIAGFIVAGSLGKDTAVKHCTTDVDLLVVFKAFDPSRYSKYLEFIEGALLRGSNAEELKLTRKKFPVNMIGSEMSARQELAEVGEHMLRGEAEYLRAVWKEGAIAELLPGGALTQMRAVTSDANRELWRNWCTTFAYSPWSPCCTEFSVEFVGKQPAHILVAIRALKEWRNALKIEKPQFTISSFALELLAIATEQERTCSTSRDVFVGVLQVLCKPDDSINVFWTDYYAREAIPKDVLVQRPLVLDPAKYWNNTVQKSNLRLVRPLAKKALEALGYSLKKSPGSISGAVSISAAAC